LFSFSFQKKRVYSFLLIRKKIAICLVSGVVAATLRNRDKSMMSLYNYVIMAIAGESGVMAQSYTF
jgi:hypothetical protein